METCQVTQIGGTFWSRLAPDACLPWMLKEKERHLKMLGGYHLAETTLTQANLRQSQRQDPQSSMSHLSHLGHQRTTQKLRQGQAAPCPLQLLLSLS